MWFFRPWKCNNKNEILGCWIFLYSDSCSWNVISATLLLLLEGNSEQVSSNGSILYKLLKVYHVLMRDFNCFTRLFSPGLFLGWIGESLYTFSTIDLATLSPTLCLTKSVDTLHYSQNPTFCCFLRCRMVWCGWWYLIKGRCEAP